MPKWSKQPEHELKHIAWTKQRVRTLVRLALAQKAPPGSWGRFVLYRDSLRASGMEPWEAYVQAYYRFQPVVDEALAALGDLTGKKIRRQRTRHMRKTRGWKGVSRRYVQVYGAGGNSRTD